MRKIATKIACVNGPLDLKIKTTRQLDNVILRTHSMSQNKMKLNYNLNYYRKEVLPEMQEECSY